MNYLLVGRPNVGKTSIFNILTKNSKNIIHKTAGTTRDWHKLPITYLKNCYIFDTPGLIFKTSKNEDIEIKKILKTILPEINCFLFVIDVNFLNLAEDQLILEWLRKFNKKIILFINKADNKNKTLNTEFYEYGIKKYFFLSCTHKIGFDVLKKFLLEIDLSISNKTTYNNNFDYSIAIFGKPNSGKSTFLNSILGFQRSFTSEVSGTTSDYVTEILNYKSKKIQLIDTAGIGRKSKIYQNSVNSISINKTLKKINQVNSSILLIDSNKGIDRQDKRIINILTQKSKSLLIVFNKIDLIKDKKLFKKNIVLNLQKNIYQSKNIKIFFISAFLKKNNINIIDYIIKNILLNKLNLNTNSINRWLNNCTKLKTHPIINRKRVNFKYALKIKDNPITIKIFCNQPKKINKNYVLYLRNDFNKCFKILNQTIKFVFSKSSNPYI
tara:strand:- start:1071 stop:2390 length:1320 start_codon:yes stop_codon:yes gene_type:complete